MLSRLWNFIRPIKWLLLVLLLLLGFYVGTTFVMPAYTRISSESSPITKIEAENNSEYKRSDTIKPEDFTVTALHKNGKQTKIDSKDIVLSRNKVNRVGKSTELTIHLKDNKSIKCTAIVKNHRDPLIRFNCGAIDLKAVKAVLYDNGELCFEGKGDVLQFNDYPWLDDYEGSDDYPIESVTFEDEVTPTVMDDWFSGLDTLSYVGKLPSSVESLSGTFSDCSLLKKGADWSACTKLLNTTEAYSGCSALTEVPALPSSVRIADSMCEDCSELLAAVDLSKATSLESAVSAFSDCPKLITASMAPKLVDMSSMYKNCINLKETPSFPKTLVTMDNAFSGDISLIKVSTIPAGVKSIDSCFSDCKRVEGTAEINATPDSYNGCFSGAAIATRLNLVGKSKNLNLIADTASNKNILVNGKVVVTDY